MYEGGENGWFFAIQLNRDYDSEGKVVVDPVKLVQQPGYNEALLANSGRNVSIESSVLVFDERVYFSNSGGRVVGLDVSDVRNGNTPTVFDYYAGGDIDATMVADADGMIYVSIEHEPSQMSATEIERNQEVGQLIKLNPYSEATLGSGASTSLPGHRTPAPGRHRRFATEWSMSTPIKGH